MTTTCPTLSGCESRCGNFIICNWLEQLRKTAHHSITKKTIKPSSNILKRPHQGIIKPSSKLSKTINQAMKKKDT